LARAAMYSHMWDGSSHKGSDIYAEVGAEANQTIEDGDDHATPDIDMAVERHRSSPPVHKSCEGDGCASPSMSAASHSKPLLTASNDSASGNAVPSGSQSQHSGRADPKQEEGSISPASAARNADASDNSGSGGTQLCHMVQPQLASQVLSCQCGTEKFNCQVLSQNHTSLYI
jgi:hypothetical protein